MLKKMVFVCSLVMSVFLAGIILKNYLMTVEKLMEMDSNYINGNGVVELDYLSEKRVICLKYPVKAEDTNIHAINLYFDKKCKNKEDEVIEDNTASVEDSFLKYLIYTEGNSILAEGAINIENIKQQNINKQLVATEIILDKSLQKNDIIYIELQGDNLKIQEKIMLLGTNKKKGNMVYDHYSVAKEAYPLYKFTVVGEKKESSKDIFLMLVLFLSIVVLTKGEILKLGGCKNEKNIN